MKITNISLCLRIPLLFLCSFLLSGCMALYSGPDDYVEPKGKAVAYLRDYWENDGLFSMDRVIIRAINDRKVVYEVKWVPRWKVEEGPNTILLQYHGKRKSLLNVVLSDLVELSFTAQNGVHYECFPELGDGTVNLVIRELESKKVVSEVVTTETYKERVRLNPVPIPIPY